MTKQFSHNWSNIVAFRFEDRAKRTPLVARDIDGTRRDERSPRVPLPGVGAASQGGAGAACPEIPGAAPRQGAPPRVRTIACVSHSIHPVGAERIAIASGFTEQTSVRPDETEGRASSARGVSLDGRLKGGRSAGGGTARWRRECAVIATLPPPSTLRCSPPRTRYRNVPVVRRTPDIQACHVHDREREAREDRGGAVGRAIGTWFRGLHNSITDVGRLCRAPLRKGGSVISPVASAENAGKRERERERATHRARGG